MKPKSWWWVALAGAVAISVPAVITHAQAPAGFDQMLHAATDDLADWLQPGDEGVAGQDEMGGGEMGHDVVMRRGPGMGMGGGMGPGGHGPGMGPGLEMRLAALDLTDEQKTKLEAIHERSQRKNIQSRADIQIARLDLRKLLRADNPDRRAIESQIDKVSSMQATMQKANLGAMFEARSVLTDAQRKKLQEMRHDWPQMGGPHMRHGDSSERSRPDAHGSD